MLVEALLALVVLVALGSVLAQIGRHMQRVSFVPEYEVLRVVQQHEPFWRQIMRFVATRQRLITAALLAKAIRRLKIVSLKTDNLASRLLQKLEEERKALHEDRRE